MSGRLQRAGSALLWRLRGQRSLEWYRRRGLRVGAGSVLEPPFELDRSHCWLITIGERCVFAPGVMVLVHDASSKPLVGYTRLAPVRVGDEVFVGARTLILPGASIGDRAIVGAGSVVTGTVEPETVVAGKPARVIASRDELEARLRAQLERSPRYDRTYTVGGGITPERMARMVEELAGGQGFVV